MINAGKQCKPTAKLRTGHVDWADRRKSCTLQLVSPSRSRPLLPSPPLPQGGGLTAASCCGAVHRTLGNEWTRLRGPLLVETLQCY